MKPKLRAASARNTTRKKYDIWSTRAQEEVLLENLSNCDVSNIDRSRGSETYPVGNKLPLITYNCRKNNKRRHGDQTNLNLRLIKQDDEFDSDIKGSSRLILDVTATLHDSDEDIAKDIANKLYEEKEDLIRKLRFIIRVENYCSYIFSF